MAVAKDIYGQTFSCACGKTHRVRPERVVYSQDTHERLPSLARDFQLGERVAVLMDSRTREVAGHRLVEILSEAGLNPTAILIPDRPNGRWPICDDVTREMIDKKVGSVKWILTVGSGVMTDLGKWLAGDRNIPFVSFATAASMNGYASANVAPTLKGMKSLTFARPPIAVVSTPDIIRHAPYEMTTAGLGDVLAKTISTTDWYLNHLLFGEYFCEKSAGLIAELEPMYLYASKYLLQKRPKAIDALFRSILLTGVSMTLAGTSSPASGGEHLISHALDMMASIDHHPHDLHGRQVGVGTLLMTELYKRVLETESPDVTLPPEGVDVPFWGPLAQVVRKNHEKKLPGIESAIETLRMGHAWDDLRRALADRVHPPQVLYDCLSGAGAAVCAEDINVDRSRLLSALLHAHEIRPRFTILDLARIVGVMPHMAEEIIDVFSS